MAVDEKSRHALRRKLEEVLGNELALTLMEHLPRAEPATRDDLEGLEQRMDLTLGGLEERMDLKLEATRADIKGLEERMDLKLEALEHRLTGVLHRETGTLRDQLVAQTRTFVFAMIGGVGTVGALVIAAARLA